ncbi:MAG: DUF2470 domain-containing protein [Pseudomonadota bacterium]
MKINKQNSINNARLLLRTSNMGVLSTNSKSVDGFPFGSVATYISDHIGNVYFYISTLAQHTKNIDANAKMCFTVFQGDDGATAEANDLNDGARLSCMGEAKRLGDEAAAQIAARFFDLQPHSKTYSKTHDFFFYKLEVEKLRFIGGFGDIHWISSEEWKLAEPEWQSREQDMIEHMNEDHMDAMQLICEHYANLKYDRVEMVAIHPDGAFYRGDEDRPIFIQFPELVTESNSVRQVLVTQTHEARARLSA